MASRAIAIILILSGTLICIASFLGDTLNFLGVRKDWVAFLAENARIGLVIQLVIVFLAAVILAIGTEKEKDWMDTGDKKSEIRNDKY